MLIVDEIFYSLQGESTYTGFPTVFVRLFGCPVGCSYCDQPQRAEDKKRMSLERVVSAVQKYKWVKYVCITGGEPMVQEDVLPLVYELQTLGYSVSIETSGCVYIEPSGYKRSYKYVMDIKCPSSGVKDKNVFENLVHLQKNDEVKYVIRDRRDYRFMLSVMKRYPTSAQVLVSPMFLEGKMTVSGAELSKWIAQDKLGSVRVQLQCHRFWGVK